ncbi:hypothetical protein [Nocardia sp. NPDC058114]|uniref:hypothetical protein n=1 Tax=Nocardia sp. NPDC058114 TaxID=3346346 RepID=UPI0036DB3252
MTAGRVALILTALTVTVLAAALIVLKWDDANKVFTAVAALAGVAGVGVAIWAALGAKPRKSVKVKKSGNAISGPNGVAVSGAKVAATHDGEVAVVDSGKADARLGGSAVSGADVD